MMFYKSPTQDPANHRYNNDIKALQRGPLAGVLALATETLRPEEAHAWQAHLDNTYLLVALQLPTDHRLSDLLLSLQTKTASSTWLGTARQKIVSPNLPFDAPGLVWLSGLQLELSATNRGGTWTGKPRFILHKL